MKVTRKQVARQAGVSESTVSYVVNNGPRSVSDATRQRVQQAIEELGYRPNALASSLRKQQTRIIGLVVPDTANPFYGQVARVVESAFDAVGYAVMLCNSGGSQSRTQRYLDQLVLNQVAGIMLMPTGDIEPTNEMLETLRGIDPPVILLDYGSEIFPSILADEVQIGYIATRHLIELGHRRIAHVARHTVNAHHKNRYRGYCVALAEAGLPLDEALITQVGEHPEDGVQAGRHLLGMDDRPTAVFAHNDMNAIGVIRAAYDLGLSLPDDLSVIGCDNIRFGAFMQPALTTIIFDIEEMGRLAVNALLAQLEAGAVAGAEALPVLQPRLLIRGSTAAPMASAR